MNEIIKLVVEVFFFGLAGYLVVKAAKFHYKSDYARISAQWGLRPPENIGDYCDYLGFKMKRMASLEERISFLENVISRTDNCEWLQFIGNWIADDTPRDLVSGKWQPFNIWAEKRFRQLRCSEIGPGWMELNRGDGWPRSFRGEFIADVEAGLAAFKRNDYATALREFRSAAEQGDAWAQATLGAMYDEGLGVPQDKTQAAAWYRKAAEQGYAKAQYNLGLMYAYGHGVPQDKKQAVAWYRKAAEQGISEAQSAVKALGEYGKGDLGTVS